MVTPTLVLTAPDGQPNTYELTTPAGPGLLARSLPATSIVLRTDPVYVEDYLAAAGGNVRSAAIAALAANPLAVNFIMPVGTYTWSGGALTQTQGLRINTNWWLDGTVLEIDKAGVAGGQEIMFLYNPVGGVGERINFYGGRFRLLNAMTSRFGYAIGIANASNCEIVDCEAECTLVPAATSGGQRWGFALFGGAAGVSGAGRNNRFVRSRVIASQIQGCGAGRSCDGVSVVDTQAFAPIDYAISVVTILPTSSMQNVLIDRVQCFNAAGSGVVFGGGDGNTPGEGVGVVRNFKMSNIQLAGDHVDDLDFPFVAPVVFVGGIITGGVSICDVSTKLASNNVGQSSGMNIGGTPDQVAASDWQGLIISNFNADVVNSLDPIEQILLVLAVGAQGVQIDNIRGTGPRGARISNCDQMSINNVNFDNGSLQIEAPSRNLSRIGITNSNIVRNSSFLAALRFTIFGGAAHNVDGVSISNCYLRGHGVPALETLLGGGTMQMVLGEVNMDARVLSPETIAGIVNAVACLNVPLPTTLSVVVPVLAAATLGYATVSTVGTRLAGVAVNTPLVWNPQSQLAAAGANQGGMIGARFSAANTIECAFLGQLAGGAANISFWTP